MIKDPNDERLSIITPIRYQYQGTGTDMTKNHCIGDIEFTQGELLTSGNNMINQISCGSNTNNSGNFYSWPASTAGGQSSSKEPNSVCPKGWQLTTNAATDTKSFYYLIRTVYNIQEDDSDSRVRPLPMSFIRSGYHNLGSHKDRGSSGNYWSALGYSGAYAYFLRFHFGNLDLQGGYSRYYGLSVRCVSR